MSRFNLTARMSRSEPIPRNKDLLIMELYNYNDPSNKLGLVYDVNINISSIEDHRPPSQVLLDSPRLDGELPDPLEEDHDDSDERPCT